MTVSARLDGFPHVPSTRLIQRVSCRSQCLGSLSLLPLFWLVPRTTEYGRMTYDLPHSAIFNHEHICSVMAG